MTVTDPDAVRLASRVHRDGSVAVVTFSGTLDRSSVSHAARVLEPILQERPARVVADVTDASVDADGVAVLALIGRQIAREHLRFAVVTSSPDLAHRVREFEIRPRVRVFPTLAIAITATG